MKSLGFSFIVTGSVTQAALAVDALNGADFKGSELIVAYARVCANLSVLLLPPKGRTPILPFEHNRRSVT